ncbi:MAG: TetR/AcrR family transcriptional regulator [Pseudonocardiaceae bacterium]
MTRQPIWLRPGPEPGVGRPPEWSCELITTAAVAVADAEGLAAVTMRRVAAELGAGAASLYRHVATRDDLVDLMVDRALGEMDPIPDTGHWRADVVAAHLARLRCLRLRPWVLDGILSRPPIGPNSLRMTEETLRLLAPHPAPGSAKMEAITVLAGLLNTIAQHERPRRGIPDHEFLAAQMTLLHRAVSDGAHPHLAAAFANPDPHSNEAPDERLGRILNLVLDGLLPEP